MSNGFAFEPATSATITRLVPTLNRVYNASLTCAFTTRLETSFKPLLFNTFKEYDEDDESSHRHTMYFPFLTKDRLCTFSFDLAFHTMLFLRTLLSVAPITCPSGKRHEDVNSASLLDFEITLIPLMFFLLVLIVSLEISDPTPYCTCCVCVCVCVFMRTTLDHPHIPYPIRSTPSYS